MESSKQLKQRIDVAWRRKWWILVPTVLGVASSLTLLGVMPKVYRATTTIVMTRQSVPEDLGRSAATLHTEERMRSLPVQIRGRSFLEQIARKCGMISANAGEAEIESTCWRLGSKITTELDVQDYSWLRISVEDGDPRRAADIANRLADLLIAQNSEMRTSRAAGTLEATARWQEKYGMDLSQRDEDILKFKQQNFYELPEQQPGNVQSLNSAQNRFVQLTSELQSRNDRLVALRTQQRLGRTVDASAGGDNARLVVYQHELEELLLNYTEENPLVRRKREQIADVVRLPLSDPPVVVLPDPASAAPRDAGTVQIASIESDIKELERARARESASIETYRARIGGAALIQQKLLALTRDYDRANFRFDTAVVQTEQARRSQDLEGSNRGQELQTLDRAFPATVPNMPKFQYPLAAAVLGFSIGLAAAVLRELADSTVRSEDEFGALFPDLPIYGVIPNLDANATSGRVA